jgi:hypothetical protein
MQKKMFSNKHKSTCSSGIDDFTAKYYSVNRNLYQIEEGETFGDENDEPEPFSRSWSCFCSLSKVDNYTRDVIRVTIYLQ